MTEGYPDDGFGPGGYDDPVADLVTGDDPLGSSVDYVESDGGELSNLTPGEWVPVAGNPAGEEGVWQQQAGADTCAVVAQEMVLESLTGQDVTEDQLRAFAEAEGFYQPGGTPTYHMDSLLESYGIPTETHFDTTMDDVAGALDRGDKVIVSLDSGEIWPSGTDPLLEDLVGDPIPGQGADHAVQVTGIVDTPEGRMVVVNDPGHPEGQGAQIPIEQFQDAWADSGSYAVFAGAGVDDSIDAFGPAFNLGAARS